MTKRCQWCGADPLYIDYHDHEWGVPEHNDTKLFEMLILEGAQAGLNWLTILKKRAGYRHAFAQFDPEKVAGFTDKDISRLMQNTGIVRNRLKIESAIRNARGYLQIHDKTGSFSDFLWQFVEGRQIRNSWKTLHEIPVQTAESNAMSKELKKFDFNFVGPTICYAFMQAVGMVNDHTTDCFRYREIGEKESQ